MHIKIITLFPEAIRPYLESSILGRAQKAKKLKISYYNPRDYTEDKWRRIDRRPYGGGPGMVLEAPAFLEAAKAALKGAGKSKVVLFTPGGKQFTSTLARSYAKSVKNLVLICGHYEGVDERVVKALKAEKISIGLYMLTGGEAAALIVSDAVARYIPGVLGNAESLEEERTASHEVYTRPEVVVWKGKKYRVPKVLRSGNHKEIEAWKGKRGSNPRP